ncbi:MAG: 2-oxo acid dehydrogenase subunit E2 [Candidatus Izemoplasmatales bacterium]|nr:2-oxo acid dehydrogenase subunit E2 [Candidatus Izemoplasmatales bacterium]MDD4355237.1 2-oxo acid dehydrogenase subunit E2 [Candidatus Izemoplasmatales bacterium]
MFGFRSDGKKIKTMDPFMKLTPHIMWDRNDAQVMSLYEINCKGMDDYIFAKRHENNIRLNYMHIVVAATVRLLALRPRLNRFVMNGRFFRRNNIQISIAVKKALLDTAEETTIKLTFDGKENIYEVKDIIDKAVAENATTQAYNNTDKTAKFLTRVPNFLIKFMVGFLKWMDKHGILPKALINVSPFHTSVFITNMKSIKMDYVYHHIYNFGTTSLFVSMGKEKYQPIVVDAETEKIGIAKIMKAGLVIDERITDGLYNSNSLKFFKRLMENPESLENRLEELVPDID